MVNEAVAAEGIKATAATAPVAKVGIAGKLLATAKAAVVSPAFGFIAVGGIIVFELWKGSKDAKKFADQKKEAS